MTTLRFWAFYLLYLCIAPSFAQDDAQNSRLQGISGGFSQDLSPTTILLFSLAGFAFIGLIVGYEYNRSRRQKSAKEDSMWRTFFRIAKKQGLNSKLTEMLAKVMRYAERNTPEMAFYSPRVYELALEAYIKANQSKLRKSDSNEYGILKELRLALGYDIMHPEVPYVSTRQLRKGEYLQLKINLASTGQDSNANFGHVFVTAVDESHWEVDLGRDISSEYNELRLSLVRVGDADYLFHAPILQRNGHVLTLAHTTRLIRKQQRNWVRWPISISLSGMFTRKTEQGDFEEISFTAEMDDISGGGISMRSTQEIHDRQTVFLDFRLPIVNYPFQKVQGEILRSTPILKSWKYSVVFKDMREDEREHIIRYIFEQQRQLAKERPSLGL
jgi:hypothetical protein